MITLRFPPVALVSLRSFFFLLTAVMLAGCGSSAPILARLQTPDLIATLDKHTPVGSSEAQVRAGLNALEIPSGLVIDYPPTAERPEKVLLARSFMDRGMWLDGADSDIQFMDISYVFSPQDHVMRILIFNDRIRYVDGQPYGNSGGRPLRGPLKEYPFPIPPPLDPLQGATQIMP